MSEKRVKFQVDEHIYDREVDAVPPSAYNDDANDLDLDTVRAKSRHRGLRHIQDYSDEEDEENEEEEEEDRAAGSSDQKSQAKDRDAECNAASTELGWDNDDEEDDDDDEDSETRESTSSPAPDNAIPIEPFSLRHDREEGHFNEDGYFVRNAPDAEAQDDQWMANFTASDIAKARQAHERKLKALEDSEKTAASNSSKSSKQILGEMAVLMVPGCNVLETIRSLKGTASSNASAPRPPLNKNRLKKLLQQQQQQQEQDTLHRLPTPMDTETPIALQRHQLETLTGLANELLQRGYLDIYDSTLESIVAQSRAAK